MNSCERFELLISLDLDGEATSEERAELERHLASCPDCRAYRADIRRIHQTFIREDAAAPEGFSQRLMDRVRETEQDPVREEKKKTVQFPGWRRWGALAACCALAALCMWGVWGGRNAAVITEDRAPETENTGSMDMRSIDGGPVLQVPQSTDTDPAEDESVEPVTALLDDIAPQSIPDEPVQTMESTFKRDSQPVPVPAPAANPVPETAGEPEGDRMDETGEILSSAEDEIERDADAAKSVEAAALGPAANTGLSKEPAADDSVPEPGIVTAFGSAAQDWVENVLGLPWASGGSYPLTAEQYSDLRRTLDEAGEPYRVEPGECYGLLTE